MAGKTPGAGEAYKRNGSGQKLSFQCMLYKFLLCTVNFRGGYFFVLFLRRMVADHVSHKSRWSENVGWKLAFGCRWFCFMFRERVNNCVSELPELRVMERGNAPDFQLRCVWGTPRRVYILWVMAQIESFYQNFESVENSLCHKDMLNIPH